MIIALTAWACAACGDSHRCSRVLLRNLIVSFGGRLALIAKLHLSRNAFAIGPRLKHKILVEMPLLILLFPWQEVEAGKFCETTVITVMLVLHSELGHFWGWPDLPSFHSFSTNVIAGRYLLVVLFLRSLWCLGLSPPNVSVALEYKRWNSLPGGVLPEKLGWGVPAASQNPYPT